MRNTLSENRAYRIRKSVLWREVDDEIVLLDTTKSYYYGIGGIGTAIWKHLHRQTKLDPILEALIQEYEVDSETLKRDVLVFLKNLEKDGFIENMR